METTRNNIKIPEIYFRLKYFYFIDPDSLIQSVTHSDAYILYQDQDKPSTETFSKLLDTIFSTIMNASDTYTSFLDEDKNTSRFFGECITLEDILNTSNLKVPFSLYTPGATSLLKLSLQNQLIIDSFFQMLEEDPTPIDTISFTTTFDPYFQNGYFELKEKRSKNDMIFDHYNEEEYDKRCKYMKRRDKYNKTKDTYSKQLFSSITQMVSNDRKNSSNYPALTKPYLHQFAEYIYSDRSVNAFDKNVTNNPQSLSRQYASMYESYQARLSTLRFNVDKLLFSYPSEVNYGFSTLRSLRKLLDKISRCKPSNQKRTFKDLDDHKLVDIVNHLYHSPFVYSRAYFFQYACEAAVYSNFNDARYLSDQSSSIVGVREYPNDKSKITLISKGLSLIEDYILTLNNLIYPMLSDMWSFIISKLNQLFSDPDHQITLTTFVHYINNYYELLSYDFTQLSPVDIAKIYSATTKNSKDVIYRKFNYLPMPPQKKLSDIYKISQSNAKDILCWKFNYLPIPLDKKKEKLSSATLERYNELLQNYFTKNATSHTCIDTSALHSSAKTDSYLQGKTVHKIRHNHARTLHDIASSPSLIVNQTDQK